MTSLNNIVIPDSWDDEDKLPETVTVRANKKKISKWTKKYPELIKCCPNLLVVFKGLSEENVAILLEEYLETVTLWKPTVSSVGKCEVDNRHRDKANYKGIYEVWNERIAHLGLKENSSYLDRINVQNILEKYTNKKIEKPKYELDRWRYVCNIP